MKKLLTLLSLLTVSLYPQEGGRPCLDYQLYGEVLFLQPNGSSLCYAVEAIPKNYKLPNPLLEANWFAHEISPSYYPAFDIGAKIEFLDMEMCLVLDYERLSGGEVQQFNVPNGFAMVGPLFDIGPDAEPYISAKGKAVFRFDMAGLLLEKRLYNNQCWMIDYCVGASFARIKQYMRTQYSSAGGSIARVIKNPSLFLGGGITSGGSFAFRVANHFQIMGSSSISLLMGCMTNRVTYRSYAPSISQAGNPQPTTERTRVPNRSQLVPGFEEKFGFTFDFPISCNGTFSIEAGYLFQIFLNAIQNFDITVIVDASDLTSSGLVFTDGYYAQGFQRTLSNFILTGPYLNLNATF